jgi:hypothetical protein
MSKRLMYTGGFLLSSVLVFWAVYGLIAFLQNTGPAEEAVTEDHKQMDAYYDALDSLEITTAAPKDSSEQTPRETTEETDEEAVGAYSLGRIDTLFSFLENPEAFLNKRYPPTPQSPTIDTAAIQRMIAAEVTKRESLIDSLQIKTNRLKDSLVQVSSSPLPPPEFKKLAKIYEAMEPTSAADVLNSLSDQTAAAVLKQMKQRQAAEILASLSPERAAKLSNLILRTE